MSSSDRITDHSSHGGWSRLWPVVAMLVISSVAVSNVAPATAASLGYRIDLRVLVLDDGSPWVDAIASQMQAEGVRYTAVQPASANITDGFLASGDEAFYQAVVVPDATLPGLSAAEQSSLRGFEAKFGIREVDAYNWANPAVGLNFAAVFGDIAGTTATVTAAGLTAGFGYLNGPVPFSIGSYSYVAEPLAPAALPAGASYTTLLGEPLPDGATGSLIGVYSNSGVEQMVITAAFSFDAAAVQVRGSRDHHMDDSWRALRLRPQQPLVQRRRRLLLRRHLEQLTNCTPGEDCPGNLPTRRCE